MRFIRVPVDLQTDFVLSWGFLHVPADPRVIENDIALIHDARAKGIPVVGSVDSHAFDAWEFQENGGPFPAHCVKGTRGWLLVDGVMTKRTRFIPMSQPNQTLVGESKQSEGNRVYGPADFAREALSGVDLYFEKEVYSAFSNPNAEIYFDVLVEEMGGKDEVTFQVYGYCTGMAPDGNFFCVGSMAAGLAQRGYKVQILADACAPLKIPGREADYEASIEKLKALGIEWVVGMDCLKG